MLGLRGCRLGIVYPEIYAMQARAIFEAFTTVQKQSGKAPLVEVMIPLVQHQKEFSVVKNTIDDMARQVSKEMGAVVNYKTGSMIELPRAALRAADLVDAGCEFFSFGTNDLTQTALGLSRDDAGRFLPAYQKSGVFVEDPFVSIDQSGVGELVEIAVERGRKQDNDLKIGICGEHGGDPASIEFFARAGLDYVSCSPYRVPIARLAAAQASIRLKLKPRKMAKPAKSGKVINIRRAKKQKSKAKKSSRKNGKLRRAA
jgi:pyruvate,orthophosphate dikinase